MIDRNYKYSLSPVVEQFSDNRALQIRWRPFSTAVKTFNIIVGISVGMIPLLFVVNKPWFITLVSTWGGKAILAAMSVAVFAGMNKAIG
jgi:tight adherence protein B